MCGELLWTVRQVSVLRSLNMHSKEKDLIGTCGSMCVS